MIDIGTKIYLLSGLFILLSVAGVVVYQNIKHKRKNSNSWSTVRSGKIGTGMSTVYRKNNKKKRKK